MTENVYAHIGEICDASDKLSQIDPERAVRFLEGFRERNDFHPWGNFFILRHTEKAYEAAVSADEQKNRLMALRHLALCFFETTPWHQPGWPIILRAVCRTKHYPSVVASLIEQLKCAPALESQWLTMTVVECLLNASQHDRELIIKKTLVSNLLTHDMVSGVVRLAVFLSELREALANTPTAQRWGVEFGIGPALRYDEKGISYVNISRLALTQLEDWLLPLSAPFFNALFALFKWRFPVFDDIFLENWTSMSSADVHHGQFTQLIQPFLPHTPPAPPKPTRLSPAIPHEGELWVRAGNGQLWALHNYLENPEATCRAAILVAEAMQAGQHEKLYNWVKQDPWWPRCNPVANIARIALNAGWYASPDSADVVFQNWAERYRRALQRGYLLSGHAHTYLPLVPLIPELKTKRLSVFVPERFLPCLDKKRVVFATAFASQIETHFQKGNVHHLWSAANVGIQLQDLVCVTPPISAWPYRPHTDWRISFENLVTECEAAIHTTRAEVFMAACGGYGLPLADEIHRRTGITCVYSGHIGNMLFGIYTNDFQALPFYAKNNDLPYWIDGQLTESHPEIANIDQGRYAATPRSTD